MIYSMLTNNSFAFLSLQIEFQGLILAASESGEVEQH